MVTGGGGCGGRPRVAARVLKRGGWCCEMGKNKMKKMVCLFVAYIKTRTICNLLFTL